VRPAGVSCKIQLAPISQATQRGRRSTRLWKTRETSAFLFLRFLIQSPREDTAGNSSLCRERVARPRPPASATPRYPAFWVPWGPPISIAFDGGGRIYWLGRRRRIRIPSEEWTLSALERDAARRHASRPGVLLLSSLCVRWSGVGVYSWQRTPVVAERSIVWMETFKRRGKLPNASMLVVSGSAPS
jgi:hypothetical protein